jgi:hypothetical protein
MLQWVVLLCFEPTATGRPAFIRCSVGAAYLLAPNRLLCAQSHRSVFKQAVRAARPKNLGFGCLAPDMGGYESSKGTLTIRSGIDYLSMDKFASQRSYVPFALYVLPSLTRRS